MAASTVITNVKHNENNEDFDGWEYSFKHYPTAPLGPKASTAGTMREPHQDGE